MKKLFQSDDGNAVVQLVDIENTMRLLVVLYKAQTAKPIKPETMVRWRKTLASCRMQHADFGMIFGWFLSEYNGNEYLQVCFKSATAIKTHFRELRLEYAKHSRKNLIVPETSSVDEDLLNSATEEVIKALPSWGVAHLHVRYAVWEYLELCVKVEEILFDIREKTANKLQVIAEICVPAMLKGVQEHYLSHYVAHITSLLEWSTWSGELAGTKLNISLQYPQRIKDLLNHNKNKMEGLENATYSGIRDGIVGQLVAEANHESNQGQ